MPQLLDTLQSYVPSIVARRVSASDGAALEPAEDRFEAAAMFADISGFTPLTEFLAQRGPAGVEELSRMLNSYFGEMIDLIRDHGGDIVKFAGDALLAIWPAHDEDLATVTRRASQCALHVKRDLNDHEVAEGVRLSLKVNVGCGDLLAAYVGGQREQMRYLVAGAPLLQIRSMADLARPGDVVVSEEAWDLIGGYCLGDPTDGTQTRLLAVRDEVEVKALVPTRLTTDVEPALRNYIPNTILTRVDVGQVDWLDELRRITSLFISVTDVDHASAGALDTLQQIMTVMQNAVYRYEGSAKEIGFDDKGMVLIAAFGLPPVSHEDDPLRGLRAALEIERNIRAMGLDCSVALTTGRVFCAPVGNSSRREYTMYGDEINLAARLMQATLQGGVVCDEATRQAAIGQMSFDHLPRFVLKGRSEAVDVYRPVSAEVAGVPPMIGRGDELAVMAERLRALREGIGGAIVIEGEPGIGKSRLVEELTEEASRLDVQPVIGSAAAIEASTAYFAWRAVFGKLMGIDETSPVHARRSAVLQRIESDPNQSRLAPLLNTVLGLDIPENDLTAQMTGQVRADNTHGLLMGILNEEAAKRPLLLILEDAHWLDSSSWALTQLVHRDVGKALLVIVTRPLPDPIPAPFQRIVDDSDVSYLTLDTLTPDDSRDLITERLGVAEVSEPVTNLIYRRAGGNPFFMEELTSSLREGGWVVVSEGVCQLAPGAGDLEGIDLPDTLQGVVTSRIDLLTAQQQIAVKVASVIGRVFPYDILKDIHPVQDDVPRLEEFLAAITRLDLTRVQTPEPDLSYIFKHVVTQEVAYNLMPFAQRRQIHRSVAEWYEHNYAEDLSSRYPLLAYHWGRADSTPKAIEYLEKAGEQALLRFANQEAVVFFDDALSLVDSTGYEIDSARRARWERQIGHAYLDLGRLTESKEHLQRTLALLDWPAPIGGVKSGVSLVGELARQIRHRFKSTRVLDQSDPKARGMLEAAGAYERLAQIHYHGSDRAQVAYACVRTLNLSERVEPTPQAARAYANMCIATSMIPLHRAARFYARRALEIAEAADDLATLVMVLERGALYYSGAGEWNVSTEGFERAIEIADRLGDRRLWSEGTALLGLVRYHQGQFALSRDMLASVNEEGLRSGDEQQRAWGLFWQSQGVLRLGDFSEAVRLLDDALAAMPEGETGGELTVHGMLSMAHWRRGDTAATRSSVERATELMAGSSPTQFATFEGYGGTAEAALGLWEAAGNASPGDGKQLKELADVAVSQLQGYAKLFPFAQPRSLLWRGLGSWISGRESKARKTWSTCLVVSENLEMPYERAQAHLEIGRHLPQDDPERPRHLQQAIELFEGLGASYDVVRTTAEVGPP